jgi:hypothetical protein
MFLYAWAMRFAHPVGGAPIALESGLDRECSDFLKGLARA